MAKRGRKKGSTCFVDLTYEALGDFVGRKGVVKVSKAWLESLGGEASLEASLVMSNSNTEHEEKIQYTLTNLNDEK